MTRDAEALAAAFLAGEWEASAMAERGERALSRRRHAFRGLAARALTRFPEAPRSRFDELARFLAEDLRPALGVPRPDRVVAIVAPSLEMEDRHPEWDVPRLATTGDVGRWLCLEPQDLGWFADERGFARRPRAQALAHYTRRWLPKRSGGARLLEAPKRWLKDLQRRILHELVAHIPPHDAAHGFRRGRSVMTNAAPHAGKRTVLRLDLEDFFASIPVARVTATFGEIGYPRPVARLLASLCTTFSAPEPPPLPAFATSADVAARWRSMRRYAARHLPQGAPTSPALANLAAWRLDVRLTAAARTMGATYTRYADDLAFSSDEGLGRFAPLVAAIAAAEGFVVNHRKTRLRRASVRQEVTGLVVNAHPTLGRRELELLEAILFNCRRFGPASQNRGGHPDFRAHLVGRVAWAQHVAPQRGARLAGLLAEIEW